MCINMYFLYTVSMNLVFYMAIFAKRIRCKHLVLKMLWIISTSFYCIIFLFHFSVLAFLIPSPIILLLFCVGKASILPVVCGRLQKGKQRHGREKWNNKTVCTNLTACVLLANCTSIIKKLLLCKKKKSLPSVLSGSGPHNSHRPKCWL